jgi:hypothetical protein
MHGLNDFVCKDILLRSLAIKYVEVNGKKQDNALATRIIFSGLVYP